MPQIQKQQHCLQDCKACSVHHFAYQSRFPVKSKFLLSKNEAYKLKDIRNKPQIRKSAPVKPTEKAIREAAQQCYEDINKSFQKVFNVSFSEALSKVKDAGLQKKLSKSERKLAIRKQRRQEK